jgi:hypothetical protein
MDKLNNLYHRGDSVFLYIKFKPQNDNENIETIENAEVRILQDQGETIKEILKWTKMDNLSEDEYYYNYQIPYDGDIGEYQVIYNGNVNGKTAHIVKTFHVIPNSEKYENAIKLYGYAYDFRTDNPLVDVSLKLKNRNNNEIVYQSLTNQDGYWEAYVYPNEYEFIFSKEGFDDRKVAAQIGNESNEIQFNNISLKPINAEKKGNGMYEISDQYVTKKGTPLSGLKVEIANIFDPKTIIAKDATDDNGEWICYLDPGDYLINVQGESMGITFDKTIKVKIDDEGEYDFVDLSNNVAVASNSEYIGRGDGEITVTDKVQNKQGDGIIDVQINAFNKGDKLIEENIIARDYTNTNGEWTLKLDPGKYIIEFYHPNFKTITNERIVE